jgi:hypothetical protein
MEVGKERCAAKLFGGTVAAVNLVQATLVPRGKIAGFFLVFIQMIKTKTFS